MLTKDLNVLRLILISEEYNKKILIHPKTFA